MVMRRIPSVIMVSPPRVVAIVRRPSPAVIPPPRTPTNAETQPVGPGGRVPGVVINIVEINVIGTAHVNAGTRTVETYNARGVSAVGIAHRPFLFVGIGRVGGLRCCGVGATVVLIHVAQPRAAFVFKRCAAQRVGKIADAPPHAFRIRVVVSINLNGLALLFRRNEIHVVVLCTACHRERGKEYEDKKLFHDMRFFRGLVPQADAPYGRALGFPCCLYRKFMLFSPTILPLYPLLTAENPVFSDYLQMAGEIVAVFASFCLKQPSFPGRYFLLSAFLFLSSP